MAKVHTPPQDPQPAPLAVHLDRIKGVEVPAKIPYPNRSMLLNLVFVFTPPAVTFCIIGLVDKNNNFYGRL